MLFRADIPNTFDLLGYILVIFVISMQDRNPCTCKTFRRIGTSSSLLSSMYCSFPVTNTCLFEQIPLDCYILLRETISYSSWKNFFRKWPILSNYLILQVCYMGMRNRNKENLIMKYRLNQMFWAQVFIKSPHKYCILAQMPLSAWFYQIGWPVSGILQTSALEHKRVYLGYDFQEAIDSQENWFISGNIWHLLRGSDTVRVEEDAQITKFNLPTGTPILTALQRHLRSEWLTLDER